MPDKAITAPQLKRLMYFFNKGDAVSKFGDKERGVINANFECYGLDAFGQRVSDLIILHGVPLARGLHKRMLVAWKCDCVLECSGKSTAAGTCARAKAYGCELRGIKPDRAGGGKC